MKLSDLIKKGSLRSVATATVATVATHDPVNRPTVARVATVTVANPQNSPAKTPTGWLATVATIGTHPVAIERLLTAAMKVCDQYGDGPEAREAMRREVLETPDHLRADLLEQLRFARPQAGPVKPEVQDVRPQPSPEPSPNPQHWRELAQAYHRHHFACKQCQAAGRGAQYGLRCGAGMALWTVYDDDTANTPLPVNKYPRTNPTPLLRNAPRTKP